MPTVSKDSIPRTHLHSRTSFLFQAAIYLRKAADAIPKSDAVFIQNSNEGEKTEACKVTDGLSRRMISHMNGVSRRAQIRASIPVKRRVCKRCQGLLLPGLTSTVYMENQSRGGKKPWADMFVVDCSACGFRTRYPVGQERQKPVVKRPT